MAIITFLSDFGHKDHYVAAVKAKILTYSHSLKIIDITHHIEPFKIWHGAYVLGSVFRDFPKGSVHLVCVHSSAGASDRLIAMKMEDHYFVGNDNGLFSLISDKPYHCVELKKDIKNNNYHPTFAEKSTLAAAAAALANEVTIFNLGPQVTDLVKSKPLEPRVSSDQIVGYVIHIDNYGNAITNISKKLFTEHGAGRPFQIYFRNESIDVISESYNAVDAGDNLAVFNANGLLEICMNSDAGNGYLGLEDRSDITIKFS